MSGARREAGFTLLEVLIGALLGALVVTVMASLISNLSDSRTVVQERSELALEAGFALDRMSRAVRESRLLVLPLHDSPDTNWREHVREETIPASPPEGNSTKATAVLAVTLSALVDLDRDGFPDADNDQDGLIDEDWPADASNDNEAGILAIDDDGDGSVDEGDKHDNDEDGQKGDDPINGLDDDGDGLIDEDPLADMNADTKSGYRGLDDDGDGNVDNENKDDDDEDGEKDEDWPDTVVFYLDEDRLIERMPVPWNVAGNNDVTGEDFVESPIAENVSRFRVERIAGTGSGDLVDLTLDLTGPDTGTVVSLRTRIMVGGAL